MAIQNPVFVGSGRVSIPARRSTRPSTPCLLSLLRRSGSCGCLVEKGCFALAWRTTRPPSWHPKLSAAVRDTARSSSTDQPWHGGPRLYGSLPPPCCQTPSNVPTAAKADERELPLLPCSTSFDIIPRRSEIRPSCRWEWLS